MKSFLSTAFVLAFVGTQAFAQGTPGTNPNTPPPPQGSAGQPGKPGQPMPPGSMGQQPGQPGQMGQPGQPGKPGQPMPPGQMGGPGGPGQPGQMGGPGGPGQPGQMGGPGGPGQPGHMGGPGGPGGPGNQGQMNQRPPAVQWPADKCEKQIPKLKKMADNCLKIKVADKRHACFNNVGNSKSFPAGFFDSCRAQIEPVKAGVDATEKSKYPGQKTMAENDDQRRQKEMEQQKGQQGNGGPGQPPGPKVDCPKFLGKVKTEANKCLGMKAADKRKACFDKIGDEVSKNNAEQACGEAMTALKSETLAKEAQKYPKDAPSFK